MDGAAMHFDYYQLACDLWLVLAAVWLFGLLTTKPVARRQSAGSRLMEVALSFLAFSLVFSQYFRSGWRARPFLPSSDLTGAIGLLLVFLGVSFSIWARLQLGGNWSGSVTVKQGHTLVRRGPYTIVRHPIYTGFLLALLGTALIVDQIRGLLGVGVLFLSFWIKSTQEERFMVEEFGTGYRQYQQQVKALIPYIF
jgi:protein-S-isoprenylcysteine O-methyltransferase Ste14